MLIFFFPLIYIHIDHWNNQNSKFSLGASLLSHSVPTTKLQEVVRIGRDLTLNFT